MISPSGILKRHSLHSHTRVWPESNCYVDLWIGLLHVLELDSVPMLLCALDSRFDIDQWTFCKPNAFELATLYGLRVEEINMWRNTKAHVEHQVDAGRYVLLETDGYFLPDTFGTTYRRAHGKTTIGVHRLDSERREMHYLHNTGSYLLRDEDFDGVFASGVTGAILPPYAEFADVSGATALDSNALRERAMMLAHRRVQLSPTFSAERNAFVVWSESAERQLEQLATNDLEYFHEWAFATVRQAGAMADLLSHWCRWMSKDQPWTLAAAQCSELAEVMAGQQYRLARVPGGGRRPDLSATLLRCASMWSRAHELICQGIESANRDSFVVDRRAVTLMAAI